MNLVSFKDFYQLFFFFLPGLNEFPCRKECFISSYKTLFHLFVSILYCKTPPSKVEGFNLGGNCYTAGSQKRVLDLLKLELQVVSYLGWVLGTEL